MDNVIMYGIPTPYSERDKPDPRNTTTWRFTPKPYIFPKPYICPVCNGKGLLPHDFYPGNAGTGNEPVKCRSCDGKGIILA